VPLEIGIDNDTSESLNDANEATVSRLSDNPYVVVGLRELPGYVSPLITPMLATPPTLTNTSGD